MRKKGTKNNVTNIGDEAFNYCSNLTIYCEAASKPSGWNEDWNFSSCPVIWNCNVEKIATKNNTYINLKNKNSNEDKL